MMKRKEKRILVVDDDDRHLHLAREVLESEGYLVHTHASGFGVTGIVQSFRPDLILLDITLPGLSGDDLAAFLLADDRTRHVPIVFYSSLDETSVISSTVRRRVRGYIRKGDIEELRSKVRYFLHNHCPQAMNEAFSRSRLYAVE
jgi:CheY-like chemotaxis protein